MFSSNMEGCLSIRQLVSESRKIKPKSRHWRQRLNSLREDIDWVRSTCYAVHEANRKVSGSSLSNDSYPCQKARKTIMERLGGRL